MLLLPNRSQHLWQCGQKPILIDIIKPMAAIRTAKKVTSVGMLRQGVLQNKFPIRMLTGFV